MTIETDYGTVDYKEEDLIIFSDGLFGFPDLKRYLFLSLDEEAEDNLMLVMISVDEPRIGFVIVNPLFLCPDYAPVLTPEELACLKVNDSEELAYYAICSMHSNYLDNTVNLKCPIVVNPETHCAIQVILENSPYDDRHEMRSFPAVVNSANIEDGGIDSSC
ncbi:MAG: flagellar assembly protein FliW [Lachnospiraceae bacterium]|nr:flagellar assembly protein FliW [Lachnospiraceae bacterium]